jgi:diamine N-acetyltransferase
MSADSGPPLVNILGDRIALGPLRRDLVPVYCRWMNDFTTLRTLGVLPVPTLLEEEEKWYERQVGGGDTVHFTIYLRDDWRPVGNTSLMEIDRVHRAATFGLLIGEPDARGLGYGTEATRLVLDYAFTALGLHNVQLNVFA